MVPKPDKVSPLDYLENIRHRKSLLIIAGRIIERAPYINGNGLNDGVKPAKVIDMMSGLSYKQYAEYRDFLIEFGWIEKTENGFVRTDSGQEVLNNLYNIGLNVKKSRPNMRR